MLVIQSNTDEAKRILKIANQRKLRVELIVQRRYMNEFIKLRKAMTDLGKIHLFSIKYFLNIDDLGEGGEQVTIFPKEEL